MQNIILIGMPGCGKSTVGVLLAKLIGYSFLDSDLLIQSEVGKRLFEIIDEVGNDAFLEIEDRVNSRITAERNVIATGGSAVYCERAMEHLKSIGTVVYIKVPLIEIEKRIGDFSTRGLVIKNGDTLAELYEERCPLYEKYADITVEANGDDLRDNALLIAKALGFKN